MVDMNMTKVEGTEVEVGDKRAQQKTKISLKSGLLPEALWEEVSPGQLGSHMPRK
jgi:hypothetical protein